MGIGPGGVPSRGAVLGVSLRGTWNWLELAYSTPGVSVENQMKSSDAAITVSCRAVRWQVLPEEKDLLGALQTLRFDQVEGFPGLRLLKLGDSLFWGHLRVGEKDYFIKGRKQDRFRRIVKSLFRASKLRGEWRKTWWLK